MVGWWDRPGTVRYTPKCMGAGRREFLQGLPPIAWCVYQQTACRWNLPKGGSILFKALALKVVSVPKRPKKVKGIEQTANEVPPTFSMETYNLNTKVSKGSLMCTHCLKGFNGGYS